MRRAEDIAAAPVDGRQSPTALRIARGTRRLLHSLGYSTIAELPLANGRRADLACLSSRSMVAIVEIKSSIADLRADLKWREYRDHCDLLYFAVAPEMPLDVMPGDAGLIVADEYGGHIERMANEHRLAPATRREMINRFARAAADRLHALQDPWLGSLK